MRVYSTVRLCNDFLLCYLTFLNDYVIIKLNMMFFLVRLATTVVFVPSHRDVHHDFVYPQPPFSTKVYTAEFNAAEVNVCLAFFSEYHKMPLTSLTD